MIPLNRRLDGLRRSEIRVFTELARETPGCVALTIGEPDFDTPEAIKAAAVQALREGQTHYAPNQGTRELREAVARAETKRGLPTDAEQVLITVGATGALFTALVGILNPGDEVIVPTPAFNLYESIITVAGGTAVALDTAATDFRITPEALNAVLSERTKAIILNSPNNPTGVCLDKGSLRAVKDAVLGKPVFVVCDNVYDALRYAPGGDLSLEPALESQLLLCQSFSKPYAMTGWRVGYLRAPRDVASRLLLLSAAQIACVPTFVQHAAAAALETDPAPMRETYRRRRDYVTARLRAMGLSFPEPEGAFYVFPRVAQFGMSSWDFCMKLLREGGLAAIPGSCFGGEGYIRLSYCYADETLATGLDRLEAFIKKL